MIRGELNMTRSLCLSFYQFLVLSEMIFVQMHLLDKYKFVVVDELVDSESFYLFF